jgi:hypothetical protein
MPTLRQSDGDLSTAGRAESLSSEQVSAPKARPFSLYATPSAESLSSDQVSALDFSESKFGL